MKYKILLLLFISTFISTLYSQTSDTLSCIINWKGVEKWITNSSTKDVISFSDAQFPSEDLLPYFNKRISIDRNFTYKVEILNPSYADLTIPEKAILDSRLFPMTADIRTDFLSSGGANFMDIKVLPFITLVDKTVKLKSFKLVVIKSPTAQKVTAATRHSYAPNSVLAQGKFIKVKVATSGVYKFTYAELLSMGVVPEDVRIFGYGGSMIDQSFLLPKIDDLPEISIWMEKGTDGVFNAGDYILFYAQGVDKWTYDIAKLMFTHTVNPYSQFGYYFVTSDAGVGKRITPKSDVLPPSPVISTVSEFADYQVYEKDLISLTKSGKEFYGEQFNTTLSYNFDFTFPNVVVGSTAKVRMDVAASSPVATIFNLSLNNTQTKSITIPKKTDGDSYELAKGTSSMQTFSVSVPALSFNVTYNKSTSASSVGYFNYLEVNARRQLIMTGSSMRFQSVDNLGMGTYNRYQISNANSNVKVWDITDPLTISSTVTEIINGKLTFVASNNALMRYIALDPTAASSFASPTIVGEVTNQNLHALSPVDMVILTHPNFTAQAELLAQAHRDKDNMTVAVVNAEQVYNEFSSGAPDATSYRWLMKMLYDRALSANDVEDNPKYLLLFGRGSFDNRNVLPNSGDNLLMTYQAENSLVLTLSYITDDYCTFLDDTEGTQVSSHLMDISVGRFPVTTTQQATDMVNKTIAYMNNTSKGNWKNQICFLADDGDKALHVKQADSIAVSIATKYPSYQVNKIYLDAYLQEVTGSGEAYPLAKTRFQNLLRSGMLLLNYTGHAGPSGWGNESMLSVADIKSLSNKNLPLFVGATCDFLQFDGQTISAGEQVVLNPSGGGIAILSAARPVYASQNLTLNKKFCDNLFLKVNGVNQRIGDVIKFAKNSVGTEINKLSYVLLGNPALKLNYPDEYQVVTSKVNQNAVLGNDTLSALSVSTIEGYIADANGLKVDGFNGKVHAVIVDKTQRITTLNNHADGAITYSDRPNTLFSGETTVKNGNFSFTFMLPKDIKYNFGTGRVNYYAQDDINDYEAQGSFENFYVGGISSTNFADVAGPDVQLYLNIDNFVSGDKVDEIPLFVANVSDANGINNIGSGIGHDILLTIDSDPNQSYVLNDYFEASANSYSAGSVKFKLPEMTNGKHTLTFRVWDLLNNSTTKTIEFEVIKGLAPMVFSVSNFPNPVKSVTNIVVKHDRPEKILNSTVEIFDLAGRIIWTFSQSTADNIVWDLTTNDGRKVNKGVYIYRVNITTDNNEQFSKTNKMMVVEQ